MGQHSAFRLGLRTRATRGELRSCTRVGPRWALLHAVGAHQRFELARTGPRRKPRPIRAFADAATVRATAAKLNARQATRPDKRAACSLLPDRGRLPSGLVLPRWHFAEVFGLGHWRRENTGDLPLSQLSEANRVEDIALALVEPFVHPMRNHARCRAAWPCCAQNIGKRAVEAALFNRSRSRAVAGGASPALLFCFLKYAQGRGCPRLRRAMTIRLHRQETPPAT
jgi:hypothetical protein